MKIGNLASTASLAALGLMLAGCGGGGGVNSMPTPTPTPPSGGGGSPTPTPAPTPAPTPTPTPAPTPTPSPTPTPTPPPPTGVNDDLIAPLASESFKNDGASGTVTVTPSGQLTGSAAVSTIQVVYNQTGNTYTITSGSRSQSFRPTDLQTSGGGPLTIYEKTSSSTTDSLVLTTPDFLSGHTLRYVGAGAWQRTLGTTGGTLDMFSYGVVAPNSGVPRNGSGHYLVGLLGVGAWVDALTSISGQGNLTVDFGSGTLAALGEFSEVDASTLFPAGGGSWKMNANLASSSNAVNGTFALYADSPYEITGPFAGRFYGPTAEEFGGTFAVNGNAIQGNGGAVGSIIGYRDSSDGLNSSVAGAKFDEAFPTFGTGAWYDYPGDAGIPDDGSYYSDNGGTAADVHYNSQTHNIDVYAGGTLLTAAASRKSSLSDSRFTGYATSIPGEDYQVRMYRIGNDNSEIQLTYASFGELRRIDAPIGGRGDVQDAWFFYGVPTAAASVPTSGTATYDGVLFGSAFDKANHGALLSVDGTASIDVDFAHDSVGGNLDFFLSGPAMARTELGTTGLDGFIDSNKNVSAEFTNDALFITSVGLEGNSTLGAYFYGPKAQELVGAFSGGFAMPGTSYYGGYMWGVVAAKK